MCRGCRLPHPLERIHTVVIAPARPPGSATTLEAAKLGSPPPLPILSAVAVTGITGAPYVSLNARVRKYHVARKAPSSAPTMNRAVPAPALMPLSAFAKSPPAPADARHVRAEVLLQVVHQLVPDEIK